MIPETINRQLGFLTALRGSETIAAWQALANRQAWPELVAVPCWNSITTRLI